jgi:LPPG:FO 2-phospho-L-lactate transferase
VAVIRIVVLSGGVGGSRFARGVRSAAPEADLTVIVNTGDDLTLHGLRISPDVDTVLYALSGRVDEARGWGPRGDTFRCMSALEELGGETWFRLGDLDLALHLRRTELLAAGLPPSAVTAQLAKHLGVRGVSVLPMTDQCVATWVQLADEPRGVWVHFQEYFVKRRTEVAIQAVQFRGLQSAQPGPGLLHAIERADLITIAPSNPFVSVGPILALPGVRDAIAAARARGIRVAGASPLIGGATVKGPAARMLVELGHEPSALGVARQYTELLDLFLIDHVDRALAPRLREIGIRPIITDALMRGRRGEARLARHVLQAALGT